MQSIIKYNEEIFEGIKHIKQEGIEYWRARELQLALEYERWENFINVIQKAKTACANSNNTIDNHFRDVKKMVQSGVAPKEIDDIQLSRYACYLIVQNADPHKEVIALGQTYFAIKTRQQELIDNYDELTEEQKRLAIRREMAEHNKSLAEAARMAGIEVRKDYAIFQNRGYQGMYGGLGAKEIHERKGLKKNDKILDYMGTTELAANLFRATQTDEKLRKDKVVNKEEANETHFKVGKKVRETIEELGGTMPEDLPTPVKSIKQLEKVKEKLLK